MGQGEIAPPFVNCLIVNTLAPTARTESSSLTYNRTGKCGQVPFCGNIFPLRLFHLAQHANSSGAADSVHYHVRDSRVRFLPRSIFATFWNVAGILAQIVCIFACWKP